jgi:regulator of nonsense transcripts 1
MLFSHYIGEGEVEEKDEAGNSCYNRIEASIVIQIAETLINAGVQPIDIGIITPYNAQTNFITDLFYTTGSLMSDIYRSIDIASVDSFQGGEKDYIIMSCV